MNDEAIQGKLTLALQLHPDLTVLWPGSDRIASALLPVVREIAAEAWDEGHPVGWEHCQDGNYGNDYWDDDTPNPYRADALTKPPDGPVR